MSMTRERVQRPGRSGTALVVRLVGGGVAVGSMIAIVGSTGVASAAPEKVHKSYVCKYVSKPGEAERLQSGQNPIWVDNHSLLGFDGDVSVGQEFKDGQFRSVVIVANTPKLDPEPGVEACAAPTTPPTTPPPSTPPTSPTPPPPSTTTHTSPPPSTSTTGTTTHTSPPSSTTSSTSSSAPVSTATTYPLQPVNAGVTSDTGTAPNKAGWLAAALLGLIALVTGGRLPRVMRKGTRSE